MLTSKVAVLGTRGIPARYGGFETFVEEVAPRWATAGIEVHVFGNCADDDPRCRVPTTTYRRVRVHRVAAPRSKYLENVCRTWTSVRAIRRQGFDAALLCNCANFHVLPSLRANGVRTVVNVDGIEWRRRKWGAAGRVWHRFGASMVARWADAVVTDSMHLRRFWADQFRVAARYIPYGSPPRPVASTTALDRLDLRPGGYVLYVARHEPENNPDLVIEAFRRVTTNARLVVVGWAPYARGLRRRIGHLAAQDERVLLAGPVYGKAYAELQSHAACYVQASEVGGTHPALLEAMAYGGCVVVNDIPDHTEVVGGAGLVYRYNTPDSLAAALTRLLGDARLRERLRTVARKRVRRRYDWDVVASQYVRLLLPGTSL